MRTKKGFLKRYVVDANVVLPIGENLTDFGGMLTLSEVASFLWDLLSARDCTKEDLLKAVLNEYDVDEATASADLDTFLQQMRDVNVLDE